MLAMKIFTLLPILPELRFAKLKNKNCIYTLALEGVGKDIEGDKLLLAFYFFLLVKGVCSCEFSALHTISSCCCFFFFFNVERTSAHSILCGRELWAFDIRFQNNFMSIVTHKIVHCTIEYIFYVRYLLYCAVLFCCCRFLFDAIVEKPFLFLSLIAIVFQTLPKIIYALHRNFGVYFSVFKMTQ